MTEPLQMKYSLSNVASPEDNVLRGLFTFFLNSGAFDARMHLVKFSPESARNDHVGEALFNAFKTDLQREFLEWSDATPLARYFMESESVKEALNLRFSSQGWRPPLDTILGIRYKALTGRYVSKMPRDVRKSFLKKASNRVIKLVAKLQDPSQKEDLQLHYTPNMRFDLQDKATAEAWIRFALSNDEVVDRNWKAPLPTEVREIRNLFKKTVGLTNEPMDDIVEELLRLAKVSEVMNS